MPNSNMLGFQTQRAGAAFESMVRATWPRTLKCIDAVPLPLLTEWRARRPDGVLVLRKYFPDENLDASKIAATLAWAERAISLRPVLEVPINEAHQNGDSLGRLSEYTVACVDHFYRAGYASAVGVFSEGNPSNLDDWPRFHPALRAARARGGYLALHEYWTPAVYLDGWHSLRYRKVWARLPDDCKVPILITECGIDGGINAPDGNRPKHGWRAYSGVSTTAYAAMLNGYRAELAKDAYVHGAQVFGCDMFEDWQSFDIRDEEDTRMSFSQGVEGPARWTPLAGPSPVPVPVHPPAVGSAARLRDLFVEPLYSMYLAALKETDPNVREAAGAMRSTAILLKRALGFTD